MIIHPVDGKYVGLYLAYVVEHVVEDDGRSLGRIRVLCPPLWGTAKSPECYPGIGIGGGGFTNPDESTTPNGLYAVPPVRSSVVIGFFGGDEDYPIYLGGFWGKPNGNFEVPFSPKQASPQGGPDAVVWQIGSWRFLIEEGPAPVFRIEKVGNEDTAIEIDGTTEDVVIRSKPSGGQESVITIDGTSGTITIDGQTKIELGASALDALVKGTAFKALYDAHTHAGVTVGPGSTGPPTVLMDVPPGTHLSAKVKTE